MNNGTVYLIPTVLDEEGMAAIPAYVLDAVKQCSVFFVENERTSRRFLKAWWREMVIDDYEWFTIHKAEEDVVTAFTAKLGAGRTIGIISEAGCPGVADPGQILVAAAQRAGALVKPMTGPSSILLALMASGMNGQQFRFTGYLPIDNLLRIKAIRDLESDAKKNNCTQIFIETPYRNNQLLETLLKTAGDSTMLCIAVDLTGKNEWVKTKTIADWRNEKVDIHKRPAIFLVL